MKSRLIGVLLLMAIVVVGLIVYINQHNDIGDKLSKGENATESSKDIDNNNQDESTPRQALIGGNSFVLAQTIIKTFQANGSPNLQPDMDAYQKGLKAYDAGNYSEAVTYLSQVDSDGRDPYSAILLENSKIMADKYDYIEIAVVGPMTGDSSQKGLAELDGVMLAQEEINQNGGISGKKLLIDVADDKGQTGKSTTDAAYNLVNSQALAVIGHIGSANTLAAAPTYEKAGLVAISPSSSSPLVSKAGAHIFRVCSDDNAQGRALVKYAQETGAKQAALVYMPIDAYSVTLHDAIKKEAAANGVSVVGEYKYQKEDMDFSSIAAQIKSTGVDNVFFCGSDVEGAYFLIDLKKIAPQVRVLGGDGMYIHRLLEVAGASSDGLITTTFFHAKAGFPFQAQFTEAFTLRFKGTPNARSALAYDALYAITNALNDTQEFTRKGVYQGLQEVSFQGATGRIKFDQNGDVRNKPIVILETRNLEYVPVKSVYE